MTNSNAVLAASTVSHGFKLQLDGIWKSNLPLIRDRLMRLDAFVVALRRGTTTPEQFEDALDVAHKFSGSLGIFGYPVGSQLACSLEQLLESNPIPDPNRVRDIVLAIHAAISL